MEIASNSNLKWATAALWCPAWGNYFSPGRGHCDFNVQRLVISVQCDFLIRGRAREDHFLNQLGSINSAHFCVFAMKMLHGNIQMAFIT